MDAAERRDLMTPTSKGCSSEVSPRAIASIEIQQPGGPVSLGQSECNHSAIDC